MTRGSLADFAAEFAETIDRLYRTANAPKWGVTREDWAAALHASAASRFGDAGPSRRTVAEYLGSLRVEDLALARGCAAGQNDAWEHFVTEFRPRLLAAASAVAGASGRDLADSIYADLFGVEERDGRRRSLFDYFHGRSSLLTWLRAVLAQRHVDRMRTAARVRPLDEMDERSMPSTVAADAPDPDRERYVTLMQQALAAALQGLAPRDRLRLAYYYVQDLSLAEIGRLIGESEATVSRKLGRTRREIRLDVERRLRTEQRLSDPQVRLCFEYAVEQWPFDATTALTGQDS